MAEKVEYELSLKDLLSGKLKLAEENATHLEKKLHETSAAAEGVGGKLKETLGMLGVGFAAFQGFEMMKEGIEKVEQLHQAEAQLKNQMINTGTYTKEAFEKMIASAGEFADHVNFSRTEVLGLEARLQMIGGIGESEMKRLTIAAADYATISGQSLEESGMAIAKAFASPEMAMRLSKQLMIPYETIVNLQKFAKSGHEAEARMQLLSLVEDKVANSAKVAFDTNPLSVYNKKMKSLQMAVGEAGMAILETLQPGLIIVANTVKTLATFIKDVVHWFKEHENIISLLTHTIIGGTAAFLGYKAVMMGVAFWTETAAARGVALMLINGVLEGEITTLTALQWLWNAAVGANPIGIVVFAVGALVGAVIWAWKTFVGFRAVVMGLWGVLKEFGSIVVDVFTGVSKVILGVLTINPKVITEGYTQAAGAMHDAGKRMATAYKQGYEGVMAEDAKAKAGESGKTANTKKIGAVPQEKEQATKDISPKGATGQKITTINVSIGNLIDKFTISTTNISEGASKVRELVAQSLLSAVNDSEVIAGV